jgi:riboflavin kinase/FMN adenylyltransferase
MVDFIRPEQQFDNLDALKAQIARDVQSAREVLASL